LLHHDPVSRVKALEAVDFLVALLLHHQGIDLTLPDGTDDLFRFGQIRPDFLQGRKQPGVLLAQALILLLQHISIHRRIPCMRPAGWGLPWWGHDLDLRSRPTSMRSVSLRLPMIFFKGSGNFRTKVGMAKIWSSLARRGFSKRSITSISYWPAMR